MTYVLYTVLLMAYHIHSKLLYKYILRYILVYLIIVSPVCCHITFRGLIFFRAHRENSLDGALTQGTPAQIIASGENAQIIAAQLRGCYIWGRAGSC